MSAVTDLQATPQRFNEVLPSSSISDSAATSQSQLPMVMPFSSLGTMNKTSPSSPLEPKVLHPKITMNLSHLPSGDVKPKSSSSNLSHSIISIQNLMSQTTSASSSSPATATFGFVPEKSLGLKTSCSSPSSSATTAPSVRICPLSSLSSHTAPKTSSFNVAALTKPLFPSIPTSSPLISMQVASSASNTAAAVSCPTSQTLASTSSGAVEQSSSLSSPPPSSSTFKSIASLSSSSANPVSSSSLPIILKNTLPVFSQSTSSKIQPGCVNPKPMSPTSGSSSSSPSVIPSSASSPSPPGSDNNHIFEPRSPSSNRDTD